MRERLDGIVAKLAAVRARGLSCFGSDAHGFALQPPATEAEVAAFEAARRVRPALERLLEDETKPFERTAHGTRSNVDRVCDTARMAIEAIVRRAEG
ncbi:hypothetical protein [Sorangium cellulosum]|uniref:Uncharacterized protein n=1 Tax=Sorangium cellulosum TaxID=56 RepID=A0A150QVE5_SORCE|nr:hypothetical protein [Sorangium cellulosum]KYF72007.1 hypothetical protein BE15_31050 [Sorangium cellulosum]